jgi:hypothetical protein
VAAKIPSDFRAAFEQAYREEQTWAVVVRAGIPAMTVHGPRSSYNTGSYAIDVVDGAWKAANEFENVVTAHLARGEVMKLADIGYKDNRIDLRLVALEPRKVTRQTPTRIVDKLEPVATKFRFSLPFAPSKRLTAADLPAVQKYIEAYLRPFSSESAARTFASRLRPPATAEARPSPGASPSRDLVKPGMTSAQVLEILGPPRKQITFASTARWTYSDVTVILEDGRVKEVR